MVTQCCQCRRIRKNDRWVMPKAFFPAGELVSHSYCPSCATRFTREIAAYRPDSIRVSGLAPDRFRYPRRWPA